MARNFRCLVLVAAAIPLIGHTAAAKALARAPELKPADELVDWVVKHGGKVRAERQLLVRPQWINACSAQCQDWYAE